MLGSADIEQLAEDSETNPHHAVCTWGKRLPPTTVREMAKKARAVGHYQSSGRGLKISVPAIPPIEEDSADSQNGKIHYINRHLMN